jgi:hypothetical protein
MICLKRGGREWREWRDIGGSEVKEVGGSGR